MKPIVLSEISDIYKPDDLVSVTIERVQNKNTQNKVSKFIIHVNGDCFGLFSDKYTYISTKHLVNQFQNYKLEFHTYSSGILTAYLKSEEYSNLPLDNEMISVLSIVTNSNLSMFRSSSHTGIFICNSYTGSSKLQVGTYLKIHFEEGETFYTKLDLLEYNNIHISSLENKLEQTLQKTTTFSINKINSIDTQIFLSIVNTYLTKKQKDYLNSILSLVEKFKPIHILVVLSHMKLSLQKELSILKSMKQLLEETKN